MKRISDFDIVIKNGRVVDGSGNPWYKANIGINDKKISKISRVSLNGDEIISFEFIEEKRYLEGYTVKEAFEELLLFTKEVLDFLQMLKHQILHLNLLIYILPQMLEVFQFLLAHR